MSSGIVKKVVVLNHWVKHTTCDFFIDNKSAIDLAKNLIFHGRSMHIAIRFHFIRKCIENGEIVVENICTQEQRADSLTKALNAVRFERMRILLGVRRCVKSSLD